MKSALSTIFITAILLSGHSFSQTRSVGPSIVSTGTFYGVTPPLKDLPVVTREEFQLMEADGLIRVLNPDLEDRSYPYEYSSLPQGPDAVWQKNQGASRSTADILLNFDAQISPYFPPDANGAAGPEHYMQTINTTYAVYNKAGQLLAGPTNINLLFGSVPGAEYNDGDPIVLYDEQADRWLVAEFSISGSNDRMLIAVSTSNDPTDTWYQYSFDVADMPDYEKFGIWQDGYYMGTNTSPGTDIYVFERDQMLAGNTAQMVAFDNPWRPTTIDGFHCVPPVDNDGVYAPTGSPGLFITINDDAIGGGNDQLWIYELDVDWSSPGSSTFDRVQQLDVSPFDSNFGSNWDNIKQPGTTQELDAIPMVIMNVPQYRNFGTYQTIVCCHTVDVDATDHAGVRWYELRKTSGSWSIRQQGTYAPDAHSRWMGSVMLNGNDEIALGYSVSSTSVYPGIRFCGQSSTEYASATGIMDVPEAIIHTGSYSQGTYNRWGDYSNLCVDPANDEAFWFTTEYIGTGNSRRTRVARFQIDGSDLFADFIANMLNVDQEDTVAFSDLSLGSITSYSWSFSPSTVTFVNGTNASSQNPQLTFDTAGLYSVTLTVGDGSGSDSKTRTDYITAYYCTEQFLPLNEDFSGTGLPPCWKNIDHIGNGQVWQFNNPGARTINTSTAGNGFAILDSDAYGSGNSQDADLVTPLLDLSSYSTVNLQFEHYFLAYTGSSATLSYSIDGGTTWNNIQSWTSTTANAATFNQDVSSLVANESAVKFKWNYTGTWGYYWAVDDISITGVSTGVPGLWNGNTSSDWNTASNWDNDVVPTSSDDVTIPSTAANWPVFNGDLALGTSCGDITLEGDAEMTINGNLSIGKQRTLTLTGNGNVFVSGNWNNMGMFIPATGSVEFFGNTSSTLTGTALSGITLDQYFRKTLPPGMTVLTGSTTIASGDNVYQDVPIGFTFNYSGTAYTQIRLSSNGWGSLNLTGTTASDNSFLFSNTIPNTTLAPWWDDLKTDATGVLSYKTEGTTPNRIFTAEWYRVLTYRNVSNTRISFQVKLYEGTDIIEFRYGSLEDGSHNASESASMGLEDNTGGSGHFIEATTGSSTTGIINLATPVDWPTVNYRFTPPPVNESFYHFVVNKNNASVIVDRDVFIMYDVTINQGALFNINGTRIVEVEGAGSE